MITQPILIATKQVWPEEQLRIELRPFRGQCYLALRRYYLSGTEYRPGKGGMNVNARHLPWILEQLEVAHGELIREGMLTPDGDP